MTVRQLPFGKRKWTCTTKLPWFEISSNKFENFHTQLTLSTNFSNLSQRTQERQLHHREAKAQDLGGTQKISVQEVPLDECEMNQQEKDELGNFQKKFIQQ